MSPLRTVAFAVLRWLAATVVGITMVAGVVGPLSMGVLGFVLVAMGVVVIPLLVARRWPSVGAWLAAAMLAGTPISLVMLRASLDRELVAAHWRCGTGEAFLWVLFMPVAQVVMALLAGALWRGRRRLARAWRPAMLAVLVLAGGLLALGAARWARLGAPTDAAAVLARAEAVVLPEPPPLGTRNDRTAGLLIERDCIEGSCAVQVRVEAPDAPPMHVRYERWAADAPLVVHVLDQWRILEGRHPDARRAVIRTAFDVESSSARDLRVVDIADRFGPSAASLLLGLLAVLGVLGSSRVGPFAPLVWLRLGARRARGADSDRLDEVIALHMTHVAVLVVAVLPLVAGAWVGLVL